MQSARVINRRTLLGAIGAVAATGYLTACGGSVDTASGGSDVSDSDEPPASYEHLFAGYTATDEPNGDLAMVVWPDFVAASPPEIRELYEFHVTHGEVMRYFPCFCGCNDGSGHHNNRDCYIRTVHPNGSVTFDPMAPT